MLVCASVGQPVLFDTIFIIKHEFLSRIIIQCKAEKSPLCDEKTLKFLIALTIERFRLKCRRELLNPLASCLHFFYFFLSSLKSSFSGNGYGASVSSMTKVSVDLRFRWFEVNNFLIKFWIIWDACALINIHITHSTNSKRAYTYIFSVNVKAIRRSMLGGRETKVIFILQQSGSDVMIKIFLFSCEIECLLKLIGVDNARQTNGMSYRNSSLAS